MHSRRTNEPMVDSETLRMLYVEHNRQATARRQKIHGITERTVGILTIVGGWLLLSSTPLSRALRWVVVGQVVVLVLPACYSVYVNNRSYLTTARVIRNLTSAMGLYHPGAVLPDEALFRRESGGSAAGARGFLDGVLPHWLTIVSISTLCILAALLR